jgi:LysW-gamma-L-lysine carboxypeptidase
MTAARLTGRDNYPEWLLSRMISIPSPSGHERELADFLAGQLGSLGFDAGVDAAGNVVGEIGAAARPRILLLGHIDTVPVTTPPRRVGSVLYGRGAVDAKGPLATMTIAAAAAADLPARFVVAGAVGEEVPGSRGARHLLATQPTPDAVIIGEPSGWDGVCLGYQGRTGIVYRVDRPAQHTSGPHERAVELAADFWHHVCDRLRATAVPGQSFASGTAALVRLRGDIEHAMAEITCRVPPGFDFDTFHADLVAAGGGGTVELDERVPAIRRSRRDPVVRALVAGVRAEGVPVSLKVKSGTSDMNVVAPHWPVPMGAYGPGDAHLDHTDHEHIDVRELHRAIRVLGRALRALATG